MWRIVYYSLALTAATRADGVSQHQSAPAATAYHVIGRCHDNSTAVGLKARVYAVINQGREPLATCQEDGLFDVLVPTSATHLVLALTGYRTVTVPIHFTPNIPADAQFQIWNWAMMTPADSMLTPMPPAEKNFLWLSFNGLDSTAVDRITYTLTSPTTAKSPQLGVSLKSLKRARGRGLPFSVEPGTYTATLKTSDGRFISTEQITTQPGVTFKAIRVIKPAASAPTTTMLYFDQSSHELRVDSKSTLDSIAQLLVSQPNLLATVTGYTDNVGKRDANVNLSEYRARIVERYLQRHGVRTDQLVTNWKGPDSTASPTDAELIKSRSRRVVIQLSPK